MTFTAELRDRQTLVRRDERFEAPAGNYWGLSTSGAVPSDGSLRSKDLLGYVLGATMTLGPLAATAWVGI